MSVKLTTHQRGKVIVVDTSGRVTLGEGSSTLRTTIRALVAGGSRQIVLNMAEVTYMDSSGLGELLAAHTSVSTAGGELKLLNLSKRVRDILEITRLDTVFEIFEDEALAVDSFSAAAGITDEGNQKKKIIEVSLWLLQIVTAAAFFAAAWPKLAGAPMMVELFDRVGAGQWFRYFTGGLETAGAVLLLIPGLACAGALLLMLVMVGAIFTHLAIIGASPIHAVDYLALAALVAWLRRRQIWKPSRA